MIELLLHELRVIAFPDETHARSAAAADDVVQRIANTHQLSQLAYAGPHCEHHLALITLTPPLSLTLLPALLALAKSRAGSQTYLSILRVDPASLPSPFSRFSLFNLRDYIASRSITNIRREKFVVDRFYDADRR